MTLGSALLKRAYIKKCTDLTWSQIHFGRKVDAKLGKPYWIAPDGTKKWPQIDFNVSHQRGLVTLVGVCAEHGSEEIEVAVDIVSPNERNDMATIAGSDFSHFVSTFEHVLSEDEIFSIIYKMPSNGSFRLLSGQEIQNEQIGRLDRTIECGKSLSVTLKDGIAVEFPSDLIIEEKLRNFYATFSLKEAYTKLGGWGLSAEWIKDCVFMDVKAPAKGGVRRCNILGTWGEKIREDEIDFQLDGKDVKDVVIEQQSLEEDYIITTTLKPYKRSIDQELPDWTTIHLEDLVT
jgi:4'-phosphopantetheinyl transferase